VSWLEGTLLIDVLYLMVKLRGMDKFRQMWEDCLLSRKNAVSGGTVQWGKTCRLAKGHDVDCLNTE
jgi:hypothetical protein